MKRASLVLAILAATTVIIAGCGGGGGGGNPPGSTTTLTGYVVDSSGLGVSGASVTVTTGGDRAIISDTTSGSGQYTLENVPLGEAFTVQLVKTGLPDATFNELTIGEDAGDTTYMDFVMGDVAAPEQSTLDISPTDMVVYEGETSEFDIVVSDSEVQLVTTPVSACVVITGSATGGMKANDAKVFEVTGIEAGQTAKITVLVLMSNGQLLVEQRTVTIQSMEGPPPPPI